MRICIRLGSSMEDTTFASIASAQRSRNTTAHAAAEK
ncbi:MAG: hypothetical protein ACFWT0_01625 [Bifidobacterium crudilactis]|jgi:hypothetical protein